jgi:hypothetical protein
MSSRLKYEYNRVLPFPRRKPLNQSLILLMLPPRLPLALLFRIFGRFGFKFLARLIIFDLSQLESGV